jgi:hypothetical protein
MTNRLIVAILLFLSLPFSGPVFAQDGDPRHPMLEDDFILSVGGFLPSKEFKIRVDGQVPGGDIDFNEGVDVAKDDATGSLTFLWRFGEKWSVGGQYFGTSDSGSLVLSKDISWGDNVLKSGSNVGAGIDVDVARIFFGREFSSGPRHELGAGVGLHWLQIGAYIEGEFFINDSSTGFRRETAAADAPLPNIGAWYWYAFSPRWLLSTRLDWLGATVGDYSGSLWDASAGINFQAWEHVGLGLSYQYFSIDLDVDKTDWFGRVELSYSGPFISLNVNW